MQMSSKTTAANAALMGLGNTRRIVIGDTMLDRYTPDEIEVVLAHELGHHVHRDLWKLIISQAALTLGGLYVVNVVLHWAVNTQHYYIGLAGKEWSSRGAPPRVPRPGPGLPFQSLHKRGQFLSRFIR